MIRVGPAGWSYPDWEGIVFPRRKPRGFHPLHHLARYVACVEINSSFYATPKPGSARSWLERVADRPGFRFTAKLQDVFTHEPLPEDEALFRGFVEAFGESLEPLRESGRLAALLAQFPHSFQRTRAAEDRLARLAAAFADHTLVLEVRHRSWFDREGLDVIARSGFTLAQLDLPLEADRPALATARAGKIAYLRIHGRNSAAWFDPRSGRDRRYDYLYRPAEIAEIVHVARKLAEGAEETYVITNNHFSGKAVANALEIVAALGVERPLAPAELVAAYPHLGACTRPDGQETLFG